MSETKFNSLIHCSLIYCDAQSNTVVYFRRTRSAEMMIEVPGTLRYSVASNSKIPAIDAFISSYTPTEGVRPRRDDEESAHHLLHLAKRAEVALLLHTNVYLLAASVRERFRLQLADSLTVRAETYGQIARFLEKEREILLSRCEDAKREIIEDLGKTKSVEDVDRYYKNFIDNTIIGDYAASNRGML